MILLIDNYDSFTHNIAQYLGVLQQKVRIFRNDKVDVNKIRKMAPEKIIISPGPGRPEDAGICLEMIQSLHKDIPILGICLGHQSIAQAFGGKVIRAPRMMHGKTSPIYHKKTGIFKGISSPVEVTRYHSLIVEKPSLPKCFRITSETDDGIIMGIKHRRYPIEGLQFHPESYMTSSGLNMLENFISRGSQ